MIFPHCLLSEIGFESKTMKNSIDLITRRKLIGTTALASFTFPFIASAKNQKEPKLPTIELSSAQTILFQGDSITDAGRNRKQQDANQQYALGKGYAWMAAASILVQNPSLNLSIHNRGVSGNKVHQLAARWEKDCLSIKPDIVSILIGVNDIWHGLNGRYDGTVQTYEKDYDQLIARTKAKLPKAKIVICEPFVLKCGAVNDKWFPAFDQYRKAAQKMANKYGTIFVPFQTMFDEAVKFAEPKHWAGDGVHPSAHGAALMANYWTQCVLS